MKRRLFNIAATLSLAICLLVSTLWIRSIWVHDNFILDQRSGTTIWIRWTPRSVTLWLQRHVDRSSKEVSPIRLLHSTEVADRDLPENLILLPRFGFGYAKRSPSPFDQALLDIAHNKNEVQRLNGQLKSQRGDLDFEVHFQQWAEKQSSGMEFYLWSKKHMELIGQLREKVFSTESRLVPYNATLSRLENSSFTDWQASMPEWPLVLATSLLPARCLYLALRQRRRMRMGLCTTCGYDLRATPERCPECGAIATAAKGAA